MILQVLSAIAGLMSAILWIWSARVKILASNEDVNRDQYKSARPNTLISTGGVGIFYKEDSESIVDIGRTLLKQGELSGYAALCAALAIFLQVLSLFLSF